MKKGPTFWASHFEWAFRRSILACPMACCASPIWRMAVIVSNSHLPFRPVKLLPCGPLRMGVAKIITKLRANWGRASARQSKRFLVDPDGGDVNSAVYVGEVSGDCDVFRSLD